MYSVRIIPTQRCTWKFSRRGHELLRPMEVTLEEAHFAPLVAREELLGMHGPGRGAALHGVLLRWSESSRPAETVSLPALSGRFGPFRSSLYCDGPTGGDLDGAHLFALRILDVRFGAIQLDCVRHADEVNIVHGNREGERQLVPDCETFSVSGSALLFWPFTSWLSRRHVPISGSGAAKAAEATRTTAAERSSNRFTSSSS